MINIINNGGLNAGRKGMRRRNILKILFLFFIITVVSLGCIESQKLPDSNETIIATSEQKLPVYNETEPLKINDTFETWSRGYYAYPENPYYSNPFFKVITNYSEWISFLNEQSSRGHGLEGTLFPGRTGIQKTIISADFNENFIIVAMMGREGALGPEIEIKNISRINNSVRVIIKEYHPGGYLPAVDSYPYHVVIIKREVLPAGNSTFVFIDTEDKLLGKVEVNE